jgi:hypothetical protein
MFEGGARHHYTQKVGVPGHPGTNGNYAYGGESPIACSFQADSWDIKPAQCRRPQLSTGRHSTDDGLPGSKPFSARKVKTVSLKWTR